MGSLAPLPPKNFAAFESQHPQCYTQRVLNCYDVKDLHYSKVLSNPEHSLERLHHTERKAYCPHDQSKSGAPILSSVVVEKNGASLPSRLHQGLLMPQ